MLDQSYIVFKGKNISFLIGEYTGANKEIMYSVIVKEIKTPNNG